MSRELKWDELVSGRHYMMVNHDSQELAIVRTIYKGGCIRLTEFETDYADPAVESSHCTFIEIKRPTGLEAYAL